MSVLASLLVRDGLLPVEKIQSAIQQQVLSGGNLDTVLLEMGLLPENVMNAYCAAVFGLLPATRSEVMGAVDDVVQALPREFAVRRRLLPVRRTNDDLVVVVDRPVPDDTLAEMKHELGVTPVQRVVTTVRLEMGLAHHYDIELTTRMRKLSNQLVDSDPGIVPYVAPFDGVGSRSTLPPSMATGSGEFRRTSSPPAATVSVLPSQRSTASPRSSAAPPQDSASVPAGTFRDSSPGIAPAPKPSAVIEGSVSRYSMSPPKAEVLGKRSVPPKSGPRNKPVPSRPSWSPRRDAPAPSSRASDRVAPRAPDPRSERPSRPAASSTRPSRPAASPTRRRSSIPPDARRENDGSEFSHDVVNLSDVPDALAGNGRTSSPSGQDWKSSPPREAPRRSSAPPGGAAPERTPLAEPSKPPPAVSDQPLPSVIVDVGDDVEEAVRALVSASPDQDEATILPVLGIGEAALPALVREFPGKLWFDRSQSSQVPAGRDISAICRALVAFGSRAIPYVSSLVDRPDPNVRFYATLLATEFVHPDLVIPVGRRLFDPDNGVRSMAFRALSVLHVCEPEFSQLVERLRSVARARRDSDVQAQAVEALGRLRDVESFAFLISLLQDDHALVARSAHAGLVRLSCQDFGDAARRWQSWHAKHRSDHRVQWLIDGLSHPDERLRRRAADELKHLTQEYFGYHPTLPKHERDLAQEKYRAWWHKVGRRLFESPGTRGS